MNCCHCGKSMAGGYALCEKCSRELPERGTRLAYYAAHPEELARLLIAAGERDISMLWCSNQECMYDENAECTDEKMLACVMSWLMEPMAED